MIVGDDFQQLLKKVEKLRQRKAKDEGALEEVLKRIRQEFGCKTLGEAKRKLERLEQEERDELAAYNAARKAFDKKWGQKLKELSDVTG